MERKGFDGRHRRFVETACSVSDPLETRKFKPFPNDAVDLEPRIVVEPHQQVVVEC